MEPGGLGVNLGFDGNGHGTFVAGVLAGHQVGDFQGVAPGARLMSLKAVDSAGRGSWESVVEAARYALDNGADVINVSLEGLATDRTRAAEGVARLGRMAAQAGAVLVLAAGNEGPGLGTAVGPSEDATTLLVGAVGTSLPPLVPEEASTGPNDLLAFSAVGPAPGGAVGPHVVAPGRLLGPVPRWDVGGGYDLFEGTSVATPVVAGAVALLWSVAGRTTVTARDLVAAVRVGARPLAGYLPVEAGFGHLWLPGAWSALGRWRGLAPVAVVGVPGGSAGLAQVGWGATGDLPTGPQVAEVVSQSDRPLVARLVATGEVVPDRLHLLLPPRARRAVTVRAAPSVPAGGVAAGWLTAEAEGWSV
ncbi:MAG: S8 family serine peptidase, partial [Clostridia bacterium]|nr:S8 family serine peptidase [Clostridia bacterium]